MYSPPISQWSPVSINPGMLYVNDLRCLTGATGPVTAAWPAANLAIYVPILVFTNITVQKLFWLNGTVVASTTVDMALYSEDGQTKLAGTGATTQVTNDVPQAVSITPITLVAGRYWLGLVCGNNTSGFRRYTNGTGISAMQKAIGCQQQALGSTAMPASVTFAAAANAYIPQMGLWCSTLGM
jgi:hypothetical protein